MNQETEDYIKRYRAAMHAMQSGVKAKINFDPLNAGVSLKDLRVGVNSALTSHDGLVNLLVHKGIITDQEYVKAIAEAMETEAKRYEVMLSEKMETKVKLG